MRLARPLGAVLAPVLLVAGAATAQDEGTHDLAPRYALGDKQEVEARMDLLLKIRLQLATARIDRTSEQEQVVVRRYRDELTKVKDGHVAEVERSFAEAWDGLRLPGAGALTRELSPLHQRRIVVGLDDEGRRRVRPKGDPPIPVDVLDEELHTERYEAILPKEPVAVGAEWRIEGDRLRRTLGKGLGQQAEGRIVCRFVEVRELALDEGAPKERYAVISVDIDATGAQGDEEDAPRFRATLVGEVLFSLERRKVAKVDLQGEGRLRQTRREGESVLELDGKGPLTVHKRAWFPERPRTPPRPKEPDGLPPEPPRPGR
ncbi:MAG: hypothetical protein M9894_35690 [Planctomycetes bacterium]|nr:hypothetical protein [Planctomycetota bacterium]